MQGGGALLADESADPAQIGLSVRCAKPTAGDEHQPSGDTGVECRHMAEDDAAEREPADIDGQRVTQDFAQSGHQRSRNTAMIGRFRQGGIAVSRQVRNYQPAMTCNAVDVARPVRPRTLRAMAEHQRLSLAPDPPDHHTVAAWRFHARGARFQRRQEGGWTRFTARTHAAAGAYHRLGRDCAFHRGEIVVCMHDVGLTQRRENFDVHLAGPERTRYGER